MNVRRKKIGFAASIICAVVITPLFVAAGVCLFSDRQYLLVSVAIAAAALVPFFVAFERGDNTVRELVALAVMTAISVVGRLVFAPIPGFKPVAAVTIITGAYFGAEAGFVTGALSALISNVFYGQGPWTPFQMLAWGLGGFLSGLIFFNKKLGKVTLPLLVVVGFFVGVLYSAIMDVWSAVSMTGEFAWQTYLAAVTTSLPFTIEYAVSNVIFLLVLYKPMDRRLTRVKLKFGVFGGGNNVPEIVTENF